MTDLESTAQSFMDDVSSAALSGMGEVDTSLTQAAALLSIAISMKRIADAVTTEHPNSLNLYGLINELMFNTRGAP